MPGRQLTAARLTAARMPHPEASPLATDPQYRLHPRWATDSVPRQAATSVPRVLNSIAVATARGPNSSFSDGVVWEAGSRFMVAVRESLHPDSVIRKSLQP
jgi:hypothetical protein